MKLLITISWGLLALETVLVMVWTLFAIKNVGSETQERVLSVAFTIAALAVIGLAGGLLAYGSARQVNGAIWLGFTLVLLPAVLLAGRWSVNQFNALDRAHSRAQAGKFSDSTLTEIARSMSQKNVVAVRSLISARPPDWAARDRHGQTLLGHAIQRVLADDADQSDLEIVRALIEAGARVGTNDLDSHTPFMQEILSRNQQFAVEMLELVLQAGGDPNATDAQGEPLIHLMECSRQKLEVLTRHGADLQALSRREDRPGWTALMTAVATSDWDKAAFLLDHGVAPGHRAPDGKTVRSLLREVSERAKSSGRNLEPAYLKFVKRLNQETP